MEFEALRIAKARAEALRVMLKKLVETADDTPDGVVVLDRRTYDEARALLAEDTRHA